MALTEGDTEVGKIDEYEQSSQLVDMTLVSDDNSLLADSLVDDTELLVSDSLV